MPAGRPGLRHVLVIGDDYELKLEAQRHTGDLRDGRVQPQYTAPMSSGTLAPPPLSCPPQRAKGLGFDSLWLVDNMLFDLPPPTGPHNGMWDSWSTLNGARGHHSLSPPPKADK